MYILRLGLSRSEFTAIYFIFFDSDASAGGKQVYGLHQPEHDTAKVTVTLSVG